MIAIVRVHMFSSIIIILSIIIIHSSRPRHHHLGLPPLITNRSQLVPCIICRLLTLETKEQGYPTVYGPLQHKDQIPCNRLSRVRNAVPCNCFERLRGLFNLFICHPVGLLSYAWLSLLRHPRFMYPSFQLPSSTRVWYGTFDDVFEEDVRYGWNAWSGIADGPRGWGSQ